MYQSMLEDQLAEEDGSEDDNNDKEIEIVSPINTSFVDQRNIIIQGIESG